MIVYLDRNFYEDIFPVPADSPWVQHGVGVFETILWTDGHLCLLKDHLQRAATGLAYLGLSMPSDPVKEITHQVLVKNGLNGTTARVKLLYIRLNESTTAALAVTAQPYRIPDLRPVKLITYPYPQISHLARFKTISFLHYRLAKTFATSLHAQDAVLLDEKGCIAETSTAALLFRQGRDFFTPDSANRLESIALNAVMQVYPTRQISICAGNLQGFSHAWMLNSLIGALPIAAIDDVIFKPDPDFSKRLRRAVHRLAYLSQDNPGEGCDSSAHKPK